MEHVNRFLKVVEKNNAYRRIELLCSCFDFFNCINNHIRGKRLFLVTQLDEYFCHQSMSHLEENRSDVLKFRVLESAIEFLNKSKSADEFYVVVFEGFVQKNLS